MKDRSQLSRQFFHGNKINFTLALVAHLILAVMNGCLAFMLRMFVEAVEQSDMDKLFFGIKLTGAYLVAFLVFSLLQKKFVAEYFRTALSQFKNYIFSKLLSKSISEFENGASSKFLSAFSNDLTTIETGYLAGKLSIIYTIVMFAAAGTVLIVTNPIYGTPIVVLGIVAVVVSIRFGSDLVQRETETAEENMGFIAQTKDLLNGFVVIKSFKAEKNVLELFKKKNSVLETTKQRRRETSANVDIVSSILSILINIVVFGLGFLLALNGYMTIGVVIASIQLSNYIINPIFTLGVEITNYRAAKALVERLEAAIADDPGEACSEKKKVADLQGSIQISDLTFAYEQFPVLKNINVSFEKGKSYAIVGGSGSGKSTLLKLMLGYMTAYDGSVCFDGTDVREIDLDSLYDQISTIQQDVFLFDSSIKDNITMFGAFDEAILTEAIRRSGLKALVDEKGLDYDCGETGKNLSGGEKQRVSIARCLIRKTPVLLVDEATAALDNETANSVESAILEIEETTKIVVTHRFHEAVMKRYDRIIVLNHGQIVETGCFEELMAQKGYFYSLFTIAQGE